MMTVVADREADIHAQWAGVRQPNFHLLSRSMQERRLAGGGLLSAALADLPVAGHRRVDLAGREPSRAARTASWELRFGVVGIVPPATEWDRTLDRTVRLSAIEVRETDATLGAEPLLRRLLSTHTIADTAAALQVVGWYQARWTNEKLFRVLKTQGLQLEDIQIASAERLVKLAAVAPRAACIDIQLAQERDGHAELPASSVFSQHEIDTLAALGPTLEGKTDRQRNPHPSRSLAHASWIIARLGCWNCYGKPPGCITMRRGSEQFHAVHRGHKINELNTQCDVRIH